MPQIAERALGLERVAGAALGCLAMRELDGGDGELPARAQVHAPRQRPRVVLPEHLGGERAAAIRTAFGACRAQPALPVLTGVLVVELEAVVHGFAQPAGGVGGLGGGAGVEPLGRARLQVVVRGRRAQQLAHRHEDRRVKADRVDVHRVQLHPRRAARVAPQRTPQRVDVAAGQQRRDHRDREVVLERARRHPVQQQRAQVRIERLEDPLHQVRHRRVDARVQLHGVDRRALLDHVGEQLELERDPASALDDLVDQRRAANAAQVAHVAPRLGVAEAREGDRARAGEARPLAAGEHQAQRGHRVQQPRELREQRPELRARPGDRQRGLERVERDHDRPAGVELAQDRREAVRDVRGRRAQARGVGRAPQQPLALTGVLGEQLVERRVGQLPVELLGQLEQQQPRLTARPQRVDGLEVDPRARDPGRHAAPRDQPAQVGRLPHAAVRPQLEHARAPTLEQRLGRAGTRARQQEARGAMPVTHPHRARAQLALVVVADRGALGAEQREALDDDVEQVLAAREVERGVGVRELVGEGPQRRAGLHDQLVVEPLHQRRRMGDEVLEHVLGEHAQARGDDLAERLAVPPARVELAALEVGQPEAVGTARHRLDDTVRDQVRQRDVLDPGLHRAQRVEQGGIEVMHRGAALEQLVPAAGRERADGGVERLPAHELRGDRAEVRHGHGSAPIRRIRRSWPDPRPPAS